MTLARSSGPIYVHYWKRLTLRAAEDAYLRNGRFGAFGDLAARLLNYATRGHEGAIYERAILLGLGR
eukprot:COSAG01_NODE_8002_length_2957_cov_11.408328_2_plen_67_part_00